MWNIVIRPKYLRHMAKRNEIIGKKFNKLTVIRFSHVENGKGIYKCECECGNFKFVRKYYLEKGITKSCGCTNKMLDISNQKFGYWTVLEFSHIENIQYIFKCKCKCGTIRNVKKDSLVSGKSKSCGCIKFKRYDIIGKRFGKLTVLEFSHKSTSKRLYFKCKCDCGNNKIILKSNLKYGTKSCGCLTKEKVTTHGMSLTAEYNIYKGMIQRCMNPNNTKYKDYGGRGIQIEWKSFEEFYQDMGFRPSSEYSIDRIDVNGNYCKENCRWATQSEQSRNRRVLPNNKTGHTGISKRYSKFIVTISIEGTNIYIGSFNTLNKAIQARQSAEMKYWGKIYTKNIK